MSELYKVIYLQWYEQPDTTWCVDEINADGNKDWKYYHESVVDEVVSQRDALLEACKNFFAWLDFENMNPEEDELYHLDQMRSAIAKAEGNDD